jgi:hypothetical protein
LSFILFTQISLVTDHQVDELASLIFFSAEKHLNPILFILISFNIYSIMSDVIIRDQSKKPAQPVQF